MKHGLGKGLGALLSAYDSSSRDAASDEAVEKRPINEEMVETNDVVKNKYSGDDVSGKSTSTNTQYWPNNNAKINNVAENKMDSLAQNGTLKLSQIYPNPNQPRKQFDDGALKELADSIRVHGLIQPIVVNKQDDGYMIIAGERRYRASKLLGLETVPVVIKQYTNKQVSEIAIIENLQREDLNPVEVARGIKKLMTEYQLTQELVAERLGVSRSAVANYIRILNLYPEVLEKVEKGKISFGHSKILAGVDDYATQLHYANLSANNKLTVRALESEIAKQNAEKGDKKKAFGISTELNELKNKMQQKFGTKVNIIGNDNKGRIYIDYYIKDDLDRIYDILESID